MDERAYKVLIRRIVEKEFPDETIPYSLEGDSLVSDQLAGADILNPEKTKGAEFQLISEVVGVLKFVNLVWSTYETLKKAKAEFKEHLHKSISVTELRAAWLQELKDAGIEEPVAARIVGSFTEDLSKLLQP